MKGQNLASLKAPLLGGGKQQAAEILKVSGALNVHVHQHVFVFIEDLRSLFALQWLTQK